ASNQPRMNSAIAFSSPVGLGMLVKSQPSLASSSRSIRARIVLAAASSSAMGFGPSASAGDREPAVGLDLDLERLREQAGAVVAADGIGDLHDLLRREELR